MSGTFSTYLETQLLDFVFAGASYTPPLALFVALYSAAPTADGGGTETVGAGYQRMQATFPPATGSPPLTSNASAIQWPTAAEDWGIATAAGLLDAATGGNLLGSAILVSAIDGMTPSPANIIAGSTFRIPPLGLVLGFVVPPQTVVPFAPRGTLMRPVPGEVIGGAGAVRRDAHMMRAVPGEVIDGAGVARRGMVMRAVPRS